MTSQNPINHNPLDARTTHRIKASILPIKKSKLPNSASKAADASTEKPTQHRRSRDDKPHYKKERDKKSSHDKDSDDRNQKDHKKRERLHPTEHPHKNAVKEDIPVETPVTSRPIKRHTKEDSAARQRALRAIRDQKQTRTGYTAATTERHIVMTTTDYTSNSRTLEAQPVDDEQTNDWQPNDWQKVSFFEVTEHQEEQRLDNFLIARLKGVPKSRIYRLIREAEVRVNKGRAKADRRLTAGDIVRVAPIKRQTHKDEPMTDVNISDDIANSLLNRIVFEDDGLIVLNKPAGLAVHGGSGLAFGVIEALRQAQNKPYLELVHRLDKDTSGLLMISKKRSTLKKLQDDLRAGRIQKTYQALLKGGVALNKQVINAPLLRYELPNGERRVRVSPAGKESQTEFKVIQRFKHATLVEAKPFTGRTHQIRVHALSMGHAIVGDDKYGHDKPFNGIAPKRLCLHAAQLVVPDYPPFKVGLPEDIQTLVDQLQETAVATNE